jgi:hypothetical protein
LTPACGCGNFLVIAYRELRKLELEVLRTVHAGPGSRFLDIHQEISVDVDQFYGIEIEEFPAQIAQVAMWLMDHQMNVRVSEEFGMYFARIPLKSTPHIHHANALRIEWMNILHPSQCSYILGNPPFVGAKFMDDAQREDTRTVFDGIGKAGLLDFVAAWYVTATRYIQQSDNPAATIKGDITLTARHAFPIRCAFVSTNSIIQGEQVGVLWSWLLNQGIHIHFAHRTFQWNNEARGIAAVHCVIIGFGAIDTDKKTIYEYEDIRGEAHAVAARNINPYLVDAPDVILANRRQPISDVPEIVFGSMPNDGGQLLLTDTEKHELLSKEPAAKNFVRPFMSAKEFLNNETRWCLWLLDITPHELRKLPEISRRVQAVKQLRVASNRPTTRELAAFPTLFGENRQPTSHYVLVPRHSSENRAYIPCGFFDANHIAADSCLAIPNATLYHFGILTSNMHMSWVRYTCGRLKSDYRYSASIVYNNFPWPEPSDTQHQKIEDAAQAVLDARAQFPQSSLADLYDPLTMPPALVKAHQALDRAVDACYRKAAFTNDAQRVELLFERYQQLTCLLPTEKKSTKQKVKFIGDT